MRPRLLRHSKVYLATSGVDMRKQINGLAQIVQGEIGADLYDGSMFVFCNTRHNIIKILLWDTDGFVLYHKRRERGGSGRDSPREGAGRYLSVKMT